MEISNDFLKINLNDNEEYVCAIAELKKTTNYYPGNGYPEFEPFFRSVSAIVVDLIKKRVINKKLFLKIKKTIQEFHPNNSINWKLTTLMVEYCADLNKQYQVNQIWNQPVNHRQYQKNCMDKLHFFYSLYVKHNIRKLKIAFAPEGS